MTDHDFWNLMDSYREIFGEPFPIMAVYGMGDDEIVKIVKDCIDKRERFEPPEVDGEI